MDLSWRWHLHDQHRIAFSFYRGGDDLDLRLPFDLDTMELNEEAWASWLAFDPLRLIERTSCQEALRGLYGLYIDVGERDQYNIQYGSRRLRRKLQTLGIACRYEEFDGTHSSIDWRLDTSLPWLAKALEAGRGEGAAPTR